MPTMTPEIAEAVLAVRETAGFGPLEDFALLKVTGPDAGGFLQNRTCNDVAALQDGEGQWSALLDRSAHIQAIFTLHRLGDAFYLLLERCQLETALGELEKYRIMEQVAFQPVDCRLITCQGPYAAQLLTTLEPSPRGGEGRVRGSLSIAAMGEEGLLLQRTLTGEVGYCIALPPQQAEEALAALVTAAPALGAVPLTDAVREVLRVEAGIPRFGVEMDAGTLLPETGLESVAVSYTKGCYLGQETIARVKTYGSVQKALMGLVFPPGSPLPEAPAECRMAGQPVGQIKTVLDSPTLGRPIALAYLHREQRVPGQALSLEIHGQTYSATVTPLPFYDAPAEKARQAQGLLQSGLQHFAQGEEGQAIADLRRCIAYNPTLADAYEALGVILSRQQRYPEAIALMEALLALDPDRHMAHTNLSIYYMHLGDKDRAEEEKAQATTVAMRVAMRKKMQETVSQQQAEQARQAREQAILERIGLFHDALKFNAEDALTNFGLGSAYLELQRYAEAIPPLERAIAGQPNHSVAYLSLGKALEATQQTERAQGIYQQGIAVAARKGDRMPLQEMEQRLAALSHPH